MVTGSEEEQRKWSASISWKLRMCIDTAKKKNLYSHNMIKNAIFSWYNKDLLGYINILKNYKKEYRLIIKDKWRKWGRVILNHHINLMKKG